MQYLQSLQDAIRRLHECESVHVGSEPVIEIHQGATVWVGVVEVFDLVGHPRAKRCYAWSRAERSPVEGVRFVAVLGIPPVDSAQAAVRAAMNQCYQDACGGGELPSAVGLEFGLLKAELRSMVGGWRAARILDGQFQGWLCRHTHPTAKEAATCPELEPLVLSEWD